MRATEHLRSSRSAKKIELFTYLSPGLDKKNRPGFFIDEELFVLTGTQPRGKKFLNIRSSSVGGKHFKAKGEDSYITLADFQDARRYNNEPGGHLTLKNEEIAQFCQVFGISDINEYLIELDITPAASKEVDVTGITSNFLYRMKNEFVRFELVRPDGHIGPGILLPTSEGLLAVAPEDKDQEALFALLHIPGVKVDPSNKAVTKTVAAIIDSGVLRGWLEAGLAEPEGGSFNQIVWGGGNRKPYAEGIANYALTNEIGGYATEIKEIWDHESDEVALAIEPLTPQELTKLSVEIHELVTGATDITQSAYAVSIFGTPKLAAEISDVDLQAAIEDNAVSEKGGTPAEELVAAETTTETEEATPTGTEIVAHQAAEAAVALPVSTETYINAQVKLANAGAQIARNLADLLDASAEMGAAHLAAVKTPKEEVAAV